MSGVFKNQIDWIPLADGAVRPTQGRTLALMQVSGGSQSFNAVNQLRILGRWMRSARFPSSADHVNAGIRVSGWMHWKPRAGSPTASFRRKPRPSSGRPLPVAGPARIQRRLIG